MENPFWVNKFDSQLIVGFEQAALNKFGKIYFLDLPNCGAILRTGMFCISIESANWISTFKSPVNGLIIAVNDEISSFPQRDLTSKDWIIKLRDDKHN